MLAGAVLAAPVALSVLPARALHTVPLQKINYDLAETIAWPRLVALVAQEYRLAARPRSGAQTAIVTGNYGEAGAIDRYGPGLALPQAYSGANNFWLWGPPPAGDTVGHRGERRPGPAAPRVRPGPPGGHVLERSRVSATTSRARRSSSPPVCASSWAQAWPAFRNYS